MMPRVRRLFLAAIALAGCNSPAYQEQPKGQVLVRVDDIVITSPEVDEMSRIIAWVDADSLAPRISWPAPSGSDLENLSPILERMIDRVLVSRAAGRRHLSLADGELNGALTRFAAFSGRPPGDLTPESAAARLMERELISMRYWKETVTNLIDVSDHDMAQYVAAHPDEAPVPAGPETYDQLRPLIEPILAAQHEQSAVAARRERLRGEARIVASQVQPHP